MQLTTFGQLLDNLNELAMKYNGDIEKLHNTPIECSVHFSTAPNYGITVRPPDQSNTFLLGVVENK